ncbi:50S ribosomal protein L18 [Luoshenia tenuis]|jgi:large subunit ribosomal protein L18|uniref:50S ribosomal protein L18 n=1 Tax=Luoshenia tenuis TaxID=2763654 RepID=UPI003D8E9149
MIKRKDKNELRKARHLRVRKKISGTAERPRLCVYRSLSGIYAQLINDTQGVTLAAASTVEKELKSKTASMNKTDAAKEVGKVLAQRAGDKGIKSVVFDRSGYIYTGRVAALAEGAREGGLEF